MMKSFQNFLKKFFDEKTAQDIVSKTISQAFVAGLIVLIGYVGAVLYFTYNLVNNLLKTDRKDWSQFTGDITLVVGLLITTAFIFSTIIYFRLKNKITNVLDKVGVLHADMSEIKNQNVAIGKGVEEAVRNIGGIPNHFRVLERIYTHRINNEIDFIHQRKFKLRTLENNLQVWKNRFHWTGGAENVDFSSENKEHNLIREVSNDFYERYQIIFPRPLSKGEDVEIAINWNLRDPKKSSKPFFGATIDDQTDILKLNLIYAGSSMKIKKITRNIWHGAKLVHSQDFKPEESCIHTWEVVKPDNGCRYTLTWEI